MMSHTNQPLISPLYDSHPYQTDPSLIDPSALNIYEMTDAQYNPMMNRLPPHPVLSGGMPGYPPMNSTVPPADMSYTRKHRHDSLSNGLDDPSPDDESSSKRYRLSDDNTESLSTPPNKSTGPSDRVGANGDGNNTIKTKKTKGRVKISMEYIPNKLRRYTTFSKRKSGIMKKAFELSTLTGTQVMLLVASETGHVYTFATPKLQPMITSERGKALIQTCLNSPDPSANPVLSDASQRMNVQGFEEMDLNYPVNSLEELKDIKLFSDSGMSFPALSQLSGLIPNSSHQNLNVLPSHIQMPLLGTHPALQTSTMAYIPQHPEIIPPSSLNVSPSSPSHSPRSSPIHPRSQNVNNLLVGSRHKSSSRTPSPHTMSPSQSMLASPLTDFPRLPLPSAQTYHPTMMLDANSPVLTSPLLAPERHFINRSPNTTSPQQRVSPSVPQMRPNYNPSIDLRQMPPNPNINISPYQTPTGSPPDDNLLTQPI
ncbi:hypothetical protein LOD99_135 [Oopsacas minuta]|uniref:MADS-box domain-containing protein n=1 Tax=Oopsacas minuta TaxID=111878 RepID=A0AAV7K8I5_9METZ|nr:hypothetical protein LOD99_135 [Oopsacas minuta]